MHEDKSLEQLMQQRCIILLERKVKIVNHPFLNPPLPEFRVTGVYFRVEFRVSSSP